MIDRKAIEISKVSVADASQIVELQNELLLNDRRDYKDGFLVSGFREEQYRDFAVRYEYFYKIVVHGDWQECYWLMKASILKWMKNLICC